GARGIRGDPRSGARDKTPYADRGPRRHNPRFPDRVAGDGRDLREGRHRAPMTAEDYVTLLDWRRQVADLHSGIRATLPSERPATISFAPTRSRRCRRRNAPAFAASRTSTTTPASPSTERSGHFPRSATTWGPAPAA